ncbi:hypothetical protein [Gelatiniphilus marinus]|uniref:PEP-CTERM sorting domain-containing protein n=1 Tax=Gelatiniphilus marinus TaxID=1759464 RepID=A0ABW5JME1_9FLAO
MQTLNLIKKSIVISFASIILACGAETLAAIVFIPAFAATWPVVGVNDYSIDLQPDANNKGVEFGVFNGAEINNPSGLYQANNMLSGSFNGLNIEFTIKRVNINNDLDTTFVKFTGKMTPVSDTDHNITKIELNSSSDGQLVLGFD